MGQPDIVVEMANLILISLLSLLFHLLFSGLQTICWWESDTKFYVGTIIGNVINVIINYFLIYGIWIFLKWNCGAAIGTIVSRVCMLVFMHYIMKPKFHPILKILV
jgi:MATE family multidrug resistance protein